MQLKPIIVAASVSAILLTGCPESSADVSETPTTTEQTMNPPPSTLR